MFEVKRRCCTFISDENDFVREKCIDSDDLIHLDQRFLTFTDSQLKVFQTFNTLLSKLTTSFISVLVYDTLKGQPIWVKVQHKTFK